MNPVQGVTEILVACQEFPLFIQDKKNILIPFVQIEHLSRATVAECKDDSLGIILCAANDCPLSPQWLQVKHFCGQ
jgi:hypothetical protein